MGGKEQQILNRIRNTHIKKVEMENQIDALKWRKILQRSLESWRMLLGKNSLGISNCNYLMFESKVVEGGRSVLFPINVTATDLSTLEKLRKILKASRMELQDSLTDFYGLESEYFVKVTKEMQMDLDLEEMRNEFKKVNQKEAMTIGGLVILAIFVMYLIYSFM
jgi:hypothetical protein